MMKQRVKRIDIVLEDGLWVAAKLKAVRNHLSLAAVIRMLLESWVGDGAIAGSTDTKAEERAK